MKDFMKDTPFISLLLSSYERRILIIDKVFIERGVSCLFIIWLSFFPYQSNPIQKLQFQVYSWEFHGLETRASDYISQWEYF